MANFTPADNAAAPAAAPGRADGDTTAEVRHLLMQGERREDRSDALSPNSYDDSGRQWLGGWTIGGRGANRACPWFRLDKDDFVDDRMVVKDTVAKTYVEWTDMTRWEGDGREEGYPKEYTLQKRLLEMDGREHFAEVRGYRVFAESFMCRFVMEYCRQGDAAVCISTKMIRGGRMSVLILT